MLSVAICTALLGTALPDAELLRACSIASDIVLAANTQAVPVRRLLCVAHVETKWTVMRGASGECGITQILPSSNYPCATLSDPASAIHRTAQLLNKRNLWYRLARRYCGTDADCLVQHTLMGYNAGTAAAQHRGKKLKRALSYAKKVLDCEG